MKNLSKILLALLLLFSGVKSQIKITELTRNKLPEKDSLFFNITPTRAIEFLDGEWSAYLPDEPGRRIEVNVPCIFSGEEELVFERVFNLSQSAIDTSIVELKALGVNFSADVLLNEVVIYRHSGGLIPFNIRLPKDLLANGENRLIFKVRHELTSDNSIPIKQRFLFPASQAGILRDIYIYRRPLVNISEVKTNTAFDERSATVTVSYNINDENSETLQDVRYNSAIKLIAADSSIAAQRTGITVNSSGAVSGELNLRNAEFWSFDRPYSYKLRIELSLGDSLTDVYTLPVSLVNITKSDTSIKLNGSDVKFQGVTFNASYDGKIYNNYEEFRKIAGRVKDLGCNSVRFYGELPHPYLLRVFEENGIFSFVDLPLNSLPESMAGEEYWVERAEGLLEKMEFTYGGYGATAFGLGGSYLGDSQVHANYLEKVAASVQDSTKLLYASFWGIPRIPINGLDLYGVEIYSEGDVDNTGGIAELSGDEPGMRYFVSKAVYPNFKGNTDGYLNRFSAEGQAKFYENVIRRSEDLHGFFLHSLYEYSGDFPSLYAGHDEDLYHYGLGIIGPENNINTLAYQVIKTRLTGGEKAAIPIGNEKSDAPFLFVLTGLVLAIIVALLVNSKRKFREDITRAMLRPYNFFADIRDHRILSSIQTNILMITLAGVHALLLVNLLYYFRHNILFDKMLLALGSPGLMEIVGDLSRDPARALIYLFIFSALAFYLFTVIIKIGSLFIKNKVMFSNIYYVVIWAFLPLTLLLPIELVLYQILAAATINLYIFIFLALYALWLLQRLFKGIYVIFDIRGSLVYFYGLLFVLVVSGGLALYLHLTNSAISHIIMAVQQYY